MSKTIIITGAAGGIGQGLSKHMASLGWKVGMVDKKAHIHDLAKEIDGITLSVVCDILQ